jgi:hypothetical protein
MDESGILTLSLVEAVFEKNSTEGAESVGDTLSRLGTAFGKLFTGTYLLYHLPKFQLTNYNELSRSI